ncbi:hypothetical protein [Kitasatospora sp. NPDC057198]|uniref:hypothetical protein n=1 Tax=Kitasatospora sp. NPDC057198 TaxID=3346046 RepID=UPI003632B601
MTRTAGAAKAAAPGRTAGVVPWGVAAGALAWGLAGAWRAAHEANYPWNAWTPIGYGAAKGVLLGALAGWCATLLLRRATAARRGPLAPAFLGALSGGLLPGSVRDFLGEPRPETLYYFDGPRPDAQWYWGPLLAEWLTHTVLPALGCALLITAGVRLSARFSRPRALGRAVLALTGAGLLLLPSVASAGLPAPVGNGRHVNESAETGMVVVAVAFGVLTVALVPRRGKGRPDVPGPGPGSGSGPVRAPSPPADGRRRA